MVAGLTRLWLTTTPETRAQGFYEAGGWTHAGVTEHGEIRFELNMAKHASVVAFLVR
jgi:hypothetical protein